MYPINVNRLCTAADGSFVRVVSAGLAVSATPSDSAQLVRLDPVLPPSFAGACTVRRNVTGDRAILRTPGQVAVVELPTAAATQGRPQPPPAKSTIVNPVLHSAQQPLDARWHPLSDVHVVVLSLDGLRCYDARTDMLKPTNELLFPPGVFSAAPAALCFGSSRSWELLSLFILCGDGGLYVVCPWLPSGCVLPTAEWAELLRDAQTTEAHCTDPALVEAAHVHVEWLQSCFSDLSTDAAYKLHTPPDAAEALHGSGASAAAAARGSHFSRRHPRRVLPAVQGPITLHPSLPPSGAGGAGGGADPAVDLLAVSAGAIEYCTLLLLFASGRVAAVGTPDPVAPCWAVIATSAAPDTTQQVIVGTHLLAGRGGADAPPWLVLDAVDLKLGGPLEVASAALRAKGCSYAGGAPDHVEVVSVRRGALSLSSSAAASAALSLSSSSSSSSYLAAAQHTMDVVHSPALLADPLRPDTVLVVGRHTVHALKCAWLPSARAMLAGLCAGGPDCRPVLAALDDWRPSLVHQLAAAADVDIVGADVALFSHHADSLALWEVPVGTPAGTAEEAAEALLSSSSSSSSAARSLSLSALRGSSMGSYSASRLQLSGSLRAESLALAALLTSDEVDDAERSSGSGSGSGSGEGGGEDSVLLRKFETTLPLSNVLREVDALLAKLAGTPLRPRAGEDEFATVLRGAEEVGRVAMAVRKLRAQVAERSRLLLEVSDATLQTVARVAESAAQHEDARDRAAARIAALAAQGALLRERAHAAVFAMQLRRGTLSRAEEEYHRELLGVHEELSARLPQRIAAVSRTLAEVQAASAARRGATAAAVGEAELRVLSDVRAHADMLHDVLEAQSKRLAGLAIELADAQDETARAAEARHIAATALQLQLQ